MSERTSRHVVVRPETAALIPRARHAMPVPPPDLDRLALVRLYERPNRPPPRLRPRIDAAPRSDTAPTIAVVPRRGPFPGWLEDRRVGVAAAGLAAFFSLLALLK
jgi:hypothetical protein